MMHNPLVFAQMQTRKRKRRTACLCAVCIALIALLIAAAVGQALCVGESEVDPETVETLEKYVEENLSDLDLSGLESWMADLDGPYRILFDATLADTLRSVLAGTYEGGYAKFTAIVFGSLGGLFTQILPMLISMIAIAIVFSIMQSLTSGFLSAQTKEIIYFVCYSSILVILLTQIAGLVKMTVYTVGRMQSLMELAFPILVTLITILGGVSTSAVFRPMMSVLTTSISMLITKLVLPMFIAIIVFCVISNLTKHVKLEQITKFFHSSVKFVLGGVFGLFITFLSFQGLTGNITDSISIKTAKFALQSYIPILGGYLSDGFDLVMASVVLIKNAFGFVVLFLLLGCIIVPVLKILIFSLGLKLVSGIIEPIADSRMSKILYGVSKNMSLLAVAIAGVGFLFLITVMLVIYTCNFGMGV